MLVLLQGHRQRLWRAAAAAVSTSRSVSTAGPVGRGLKAPSALPRNVPRPITGAGRGRVFGWQRHQARGLASVPADLGKGVDILAPESEEGRQMTFLLGYDGRGFEVRDINYRGSILAFPRACFLWRARTVDDITPESLAPILMVKPPIEIVIVGAGERLEKPVPKATVEWLAKQGIAIEQMDTSSACATFNILNQEDRRVVGALLAVDEEEPPPPSEQLIQSPPPPAKEQP